MFVHKINSPVNTVCIPRRQPLPSPLKAHACSHTQQSLDIHCDCTQEDSRHCPQNVCVYICSVTICLLLHTSFTHLTGSLVRYAFTLTVRPNQTALTLSTSLIATWWCKCKWVFTAGNPLWNWQWEAFTNIVVVYHLFFPFYSCDDVRLSLMELSS